MDVVALILAAFAVLIFALDVLPRTASAAVNRIALGLALLGAAWICQCTTLTENMVNF